MNANILIVEDQEELVMTLGDRLRSEGYVVDVASDGNSGLEKATSNPYDLFIFDIMLPLRSGLELCTEVRRSGLTAPILLLTARGQSVDKVVGLKLGADDYVTKPFDTMELLARIEALLRRAPMRGENTTPVTEIYRIGPLTIDVRRARVTRNNQPVNLTAREFYLLRYFAEHQGIPLTRDELLREVWGHRGGTFTRTVDMHVASLRQKIEEVPRKPEIIFTVPGIGYRFLG